MPGVRRQTGDEVEQDTAVSFHRSADITDDDDGSWRLAAPTIGEIDELAAHQALPQHRPEIDGAAGGTLPASRAPQAETPGQLRQQPPRLFHLGWSEVGKILRARHADRAVRARRASRLVLFFGSDVFEFDVDGHARHRSRNHPRPFAEREQRETRCGLLPRPKEEREGRIEPLHVLVPMNEECRERGTHVAPIAYSRPFEGADGINQSAVVDVEARATKKSAEEEEVSDERLSRHVEAAASPYACLVPRSMARASIVRVRSPRIA